MLISDKVKVALEGCQVIVHRAQFLLPGFIHVA